MLEEQFPDEKFEVINTAMTAINSHVVREIAEDVVEIDADVWVIYMGNNEVYGPFGAGTVFGSQAPPVGAVRAGLVFKETRTGQWLGNLMGGERDGPKSWGGMEMFLKQQVAEDDERLDRVYENYRENLEAIIEEGKKAGAKVVVSSVVVNLADCPPLGVEGGEAMELFKEGRFEEARDADRLRFRADSKINEIAEDVAEGTGAVFVDAEAEFLKLGVPGRRVFHDHVHFSFEGNHLLVRSLVAEVACGLGLSVGGGWLSGEECAERMGYTLLHEVRILEEMRLRLRRPPFREQSNAREREEWLSQRIEEGRRQLTGEKAAAAFARYGELLRSKGGDWRVRKRYVDLLESAGKVKEAGDGMERVVEVLSHRPEMWYQLGRLRNREKDRLAAERALRKALEIREDYAQAHQSLAICLSHQKKFGESEEHFARAVELKPDYVEALVNWGMVLEAQKKNGVGKFEEALEVEPNSVAALQQLASGFAKEGKHGDAEPYYLKIAELLPKSAEAQINVALVKYHLKKVEGAKGALLRALEIDPGNEVAKEYLEKLNSGR